MLRLKYTGATTIPLEAKCLTPDQLAGKSAAEIAALPLQHGNAPAPLGEFFTVEGDAADGDVLIEGDCTRVKWIGAGMTSGRIRVEYCSTLTGSTLPAASTAVNTALCPPPTATPTPTTTPTVTLTPSPTQPPGACNPAICGHGRPTSTVAATKSRASCCSPSIGHL